MYSDDDMLMLSGIQHFRFCPRQWALIHIEQQWDDNRLTIEGELLHKHVDDPTYRVKCGDIICLRAVSLASKTLGLYGVADLIELHPTQQADNAILHPKYKGYWLPCPIEYKHGQAKQDLSDEMQLTAQAICLEEQYNITIERGGIFYAKTRQRQDVFFTKELRELVNDHARQMHEIFSSHQLPNADASAKCRKCSLIEICMPNQLSRVVSYLTKNLYEETT